MTSEQGKELRVVVYTPGRPDSARLEGLVKLPDDAQFRDFIDALKTEAPTIYEEVRRRVLRAAGRVLAYGRDDPLLMAIDQKLAEGGTLVFPAEEDEEVPAEEVNQAQHVG
ncbi:MAG: hypothetical protein WBC63_01935 [Candidatus Bipolaricaulia bacterium]